MAEPSDRFSEDDKRVSEAAWKGWHALMTKVSVFLTWVTDDDHRVTHVGSGIALRTPAGTPLILTAAHVVNGMREHRSWAGWQDVKLGQGMRGAYGVCHPSFEPSADTGIDVGFIVPGPTVRGSLLQIAEHVGLIAPSYRHESSDRYAVTGYPAEILTVDMQKLEKRFKSFSHVCHEREPPVWRDDDLLEVPWVQPGTPMHVIETQVPIGVAPGNAMGMSGAALWRHSDVVHRETKMWTPQLACRIVGVQSQYRASSRALFFEPSNRWFDWFTESVRTIDELNPARPT